MGGVGGAPPTHTIGRALTPDANPLGNNSLAEWALHSPSLLGVPMTRPPALRGLRWTDLRHVAKTESLRELSLPLPWLIGSAICYSRGWLLFGAVASFFFFLTGLRVVHGAQHYTLGLSRRAQDAVLAICSSLMVSSMHAIQATHLHHHRECMKPSDVESVTARMPWWRAILIGPWFIGHLHVAGYRLSKVWQRQWIRAELGVVAAVILLAAFTPVPHWARVHVSMMLLGECLTGFFAVWSVHHGCAGHTLYARTQRGWWKTTLSYQMFYHLEHHWFPAVPTRHLPELAKRIDAVAPECRAKEVF